MKNEKWKTLKENPNFEISNFGRLKSYLRYKDSGYIYKEIYGKAGYAKIIIKHPETKKQLTFNAHSLVWKYFSANPVVPVKGKMIIDHFDRNKKNNHISNLRIISHSENLMNVERKGFINKSGKKWTCQASFRCVNHYLGVYDTKEEAKEIIKDALTKLENGIFNKSDYNIRVPNNPIKGVYNKNGKYVVKDYNKGVATYVGVYDDEESAIKARDEFKINKKVKRIYKV